MLRNKPSVCVCVCVKVEANPMCTLAQNRQSILNGLMHLPKHLHGYGTEQVIALNILMLLQCGRGPQQLLLSYILDKQLFGPCQSMRFHYVIF